MSGLEHLLDPDYQNRLGHETPRQGHRHAFHEPGAGHEAGRGDPRTCDQRRNLCPAGELVAKLEKEMAVSQDYPGFIVNRVLIPMINEAMFALYEGIATAEDIDKGMKLGTNQPMGPLALADLIGLDTVLAIANVIYDGFKDSKYRPCPLLVKMVNAGYLGRKSGRGFYIY